MDLKELKTKSPAELAEHLEELRKEQFNLRMQRGTGQLTQTHQLRNVRREIARAKTLITAKSKAAP
jgi:large subunit ribosomal protein L29